MTALAAMRNTDQLGLEPVLSHIDVALDASQTVYQGGIVAVNASGYGVPGASTAGLLCAGKADLGKDKVVSGGAAGEIIRVAQGVFRFANSSSGDQIVQADVGKLAYLVDDQTVAKLGTGGRPVAGIIMSVSASGVDVSMGLQLVAPLMGVKAYVAPTTVTTGAIPLLGEVTFLSVTGTQPYTLANGLFPGQRKRLRCTVAASTPNGTLTPATPSGFATIGFDAVHEWAELEWNGSAWVLTAHTGATPA